MMTSWRRGLLFAAAGALALAAVAAYWGRDWYRSRSEWDEAHAALERRDLATAALHLNRYLIYHDSDPAAWLLAARTARRLGRFGDAALFLNRAEALGANADSLRLERDLFRVQQGEIGEIDHRLRATIGPDHPDVVLVLEALARGYMAVDRRADALEACRLWQSKEPDHPWPWLWAGWICEQMGQMERAEDLYRNALERIPDDREARVAYARVLVRRRRPADAAEHFLWVLARHPDDTEALLGHAECLIELARPAEATLLIDRVLEDDPDSTAARLLRGKSLLGRDDAGAERWLRGVVENDPGDAEALYALILSLRGQKKDRDADELAARLETLRADLKQLGDLLLKMGPAADAATFHEAGVISLRVGRTREGINFLNEALRRPGDHRATHAALAAYYEKAGPRNLAEYHRRLAESQ
jgi:tetratricopeptide (TPR) repeat protein